MSRYEELQALLTEAQADFDKFYNESNKAAGTRVRKTMLELKKLADVVRKEVQEIKNQ